MKSRISKAASLIGKLGASKGGLARAAKLDQARRSEIARNAGVASGKARRKEKP